MASPSLAQTTNPQAQLEEWLEKGRQIAKDGTNYHWRVGDWRCGANGLDEKLAYRQAESITGIRKKALYDMKWVSSRVPVSVRTETLSWNHHRQVAHCEVEKQKDLLKQAVTEGWSVESLRDVAKEPRRRGKGSRDEKPKKMCVRLTAAQHDLVRWYAKTRGVSPSGFLQQIVRDWYQQAALTRKEQEQATVSLQ